MAGEVMVPDPAPARTETTTNHKPPYDWLEKRCAWYSDHVDALTGRLRALEAENQQLKDAAEMLWVVLANVSGGDWTKQTPEWEEAAERWRDNYFGRTQTVVASQKGQ